MKQKSRCASLAWDQDKCEMEMTPMIDVTFLILIFFMVTLKFRTLEGQLSAYLPKDVGPNSTPAEVAWPLAIGIHLRAAGTKFAPDGRPWSRELGGRWNFGPDRRLDYSLGPRRGLDLEQLRRRVLELDLADSGQSIELSAGPGTVQAEAIRVLDLLIGAGLTEVRIRGAASN